MTRNFQLVQQYTAVLRGSSGEQYVARAYMDRQPGGLWEAWLVFFSLTTDAVIATDRETTQGKREHVLYWASGLSATYLQGALERALDLRSEVQTARRIARARVQEALALHEALVHAAAAARAIRHAEATHRRRSRSLPHAP
ncbi:MAG TPA: hypothetical protein VHF87_09655 [Methylomirabilota bacterium]|jgi:hypothetical protein|nr:hypothetical protein [Methylomirabilota bacterium]